MNKQCFHCGDFFADGERPAVSETEVIVHERKSNDPDYDLPPVKTPGKTKFFHRLCHDVYAAPRRAAEAAQETDERD